jgi:hypothetical protein
VQFLVNYTAPYGTSVNLPAAQQAIWAYLNSVAFPNVYQDSVIGQIMLANGASGVVSVTKQGFFYPSMASVYQNQAGVQTQIPRVFTTTFLPPPNQNGYGPRNVTLICDQATIAFTATIL